MLGVSRRAGLLRSRLVPLGGRLCAAGLPVPVLPLCKRALAQDMAAATGLGLAGDLACQYIELGGRGRLDWNRVFGVTAFSTLYVGGFLHWLFRVYPHLVKAAAGAAGWRRMATLDTGWHALGCAVLDNGHVGLIYTPSYFYGVELLSGGSLERAGANLRREWWEAYTMGTGFWLPFMWVNFRLVKPAGRVRAMALANLCWNVVIDYIAHRNTGQVDCLT